MAFNTDVLRDEILNLGFFTTEADAIEGWANAFRTYFEGATTVIGGPIIAANLTPARSAWVGASTGLSVTGSTALQNAIIAWWNVGVANPSSWFATCTAITPPPNLATLAANLDTIFANNTASNADAVTAVTNVANAIHAVNVGGVATFPGPTTNPIV